MIKFIKTQENGDATCNYDVIFPEGMTIIEIIKAVRKEYPRDWFGSFHLNGWTEIGSYRNERTTLKPEYENIIPTRVWANGGWGCMSYYFYTTEGKKNGD